MIISFAWTSGAVEDGTKTETRRFWKDSTARKLRPGTLHQAWTKSPRFGGKLIRMIRVLAVFRQPLSEMSQESFEREGGTRFWKDIGEYREMMLAQGKGDAPWVVQFEYPKDLRGDTRANRKGAA